jgi:rhodanese-related sulfurtransferase
MRRTTVLALAALLALAAPTLAWAQGGGGPVQRISLREFKLMIVDGTVLPIDVRDPESFAEGHIPGALNTPEESVRQHVPTLKASKKTIVAYCA